MSASAPMRSPACGCTGDKPGAHRVRSGPLSAACPGHGVSGRADAKPGFRARRGCRTVGALSEGARCAASKTWHDCACSRSVAGSSSASSPKNCPVHGSRGRSLRCGAGAVASRSTKCSDLLDLSLRNAALGVRASSRTNFRRPLSFPPWRSPKSSG